MDIIRNHINYGELVVITIDGMKALINRHNAEAMRFDFDAEAAQTTDFLNEIRVDLDIGQSGGKCYFYITNNDDIAPFAAKLSATMLRDTTVVSNARILARYRAGSLVGEKKTLIDFYVDITPELLAATRF